MPRSTKPLLSGPQPRPARAPLRLDRARDDPSLQDDNDGGMHRLAPMKGSNFSSFAFKGKRRFPRKDDVAAGAARAASTAADSLPRNSIVSPQSCRTSSERSLVSEKRHGELKGNPGCASNFQHDPDDGDDRRDGGGAEERRRAFIKEHMNKPVYSFIAGSTAPPAAAMATRAAIIGRRKRATHASKVDSAQERRRHEWWRI